MIYIFSDQTISIIKRLGSQNERNIMLGDIQFVLMPIPIKNESFQEDSFQNRQYKYTYLGTYISIIYSKLFNTLPWHQSLKLPDNIFRRNRIQARSGNAPAPVAAMGMTGPAAMAGFNNSEGAFTIGEKTEVVRRGAINNRCGNAAGAGQMA